MTYKRALLVCPRRPCLSPVFDLVAWSIRYVPTTSDRQDVGKCQVFAGALSWTIIVDHMRREFLIIIFITVSLNALPQSPPLHSSNSVDAATEVKQQEEALRQAELR